MSEHEPEQAAEETAADPVLTEVAGNTGSAEPEPGKG